jgi:nicotinate-nucleotide adenylyltransferase
MTRTGRLGVVGGTFDPIHWGHMDAASTAAEALGLTELLFVPSHIPPHRRARPRASGFHRFAMVALAVEPLQTARVSDIELGRPGLSYTADTLATLHADGWKPSQIFFVIGTDTFSEITSFRSYPALLDLCHFAVVGRAGISAAGVAAHNVLVETRIVSPAALPQQPTTTAVIPIIASTRRISSSEVRNQVAARADITSLVPAPVAAYIHRQDLYGSGQLFA